MILRESDRSPLARPMQHTVLHHDTEPDCAGGSAPAAAGRELPLQSDAEIERLVDDFESLVLPRRNWTHRAHLAVAIFYLKCLGYEAALNHLRDRINAYNVACGSPDGYNGTITIAFLRRIAAETASDPSPSAMHEQLARLERLCPPTWLDRLYSPDRLRSAAAKQGWVEPDLAASDLLERL